MKNNENDIIPSFHFRVLFTGLKGVTELDTRFESVSGIQGSRAVEIPDGGKRKKRTAAVPVFSRLF